MNRSTRGASLLVLAAVACPVLLAPGCANDSRVLAPQTAPATIQSADAAPPAPATNYTELRTASYAEARGNSPSWIADAASDVLSRPLPRDAEGYTYDSVRPIVSGVTDDGLDSLAQVTTGDVGADFDPAVSRDGAFMVFASTRHRATSDLYFKNTSGSSLTQLTSESGNEVMPAISPDGSRIAFASDRSGAWNLYVMSARGGHSVQVTRERTADLHPSWSPDGQRLVFSRLGARSGQWELWVVDVNKPQTPEFIGYGLMPEWCPVAGTGMAGADRITFQRGRQRGDRAYSIWTVDYKPGDSSSPTEVVPATEMAAINPSWSPDGQYIAFARAPVSQAVPGQRTLRPIASDVWIASVDGSHMVNVTSGRFCNLTPAWGKGDRLYFVSDRTGGEAIWSTGTSQVVAMMKGEAPTVAQKPAMPAPAGAPVHETAPSTAITEMNPAGGVTPESQPAPANEPAVVTAPEPAPQQP